MTGPVVEIIVEDRRWSDQIPDLSDQMRRTVAETLRAAGVEGAREVNLLMTDDARIKALNGGFRDRDAPTNVLSWPSAERRSQTPGSAPDKPPGDEVELGDIALASGVTFAEAEAAGKTPKDHASHLVAHGVLHLLGYDHESDRDATLMEMLEVRILSTLGISDPYMVTGAAEAPQNGKE